MNSLVAEYRQSNPNDDRSDEELTLLFGLNNSDGRFNGYADFLSEYKQLEKQRRFALAPSLTEEFKRGVARGVDSLQGTIYGAGALASDALGLEQPQQFFSKKAAEQDEEAAENAPTIPGLEEADTASETIRYLAGGTGEVIPSLGEALVTGFVGAGIGGSAGTAVEPGGGTAVGTVGGFVTGIIGKQAIKSLLRKGLIKGVEDLGEEAGKQLLKQEAKAVASRYGANIATAINSYALSAGEIYHDISNKEGVDPDTALNVSLLGGLVAAVPDTFLPSYVVGKYFRGADTLQPEVKNHLYSYITRLVTESAKVIPTEAATEGFQEMVNIAAGKYADPKTRQQAFDFSKWSEADVHRIQNSAVLGGLGGAVASPLAALPTSENSVRPAEAEDTVESTRPEVVLPSDYTNEVPENEKQELDDLAKKDAAGELSLVEKQTVTNLTPPQRSYYVISKEHAESGLTESIEPEGETELDVLLKSELEKLRARKKSEQEPFVEVPPPAALLDKKNEMTETLSAPVTSPMESESDLPVSEKAPETVVIAATESPNSPPSLDDLYLKLGDNPDDPALHTQIAELEKVVPIREVKLPPTTQSLTPSELFDLMDFDNSATTTKEERSGQGAAVTSFLDVSHLEPDAVREKVYPLLPKSGALGTASRALIAFGVGDSGQVVITNIFESGKKGVNRALRLGFKDGRKNTLDHLAKAFDLRPLGVILLKDTVKDFTVSYSQEEYNSGIAVPALAQMEKVMQYTAPKGDLANSMGDESLETTDTEETAGLTGDPNELPAQRNAKADGGIAVPSEEEIAAKSILSEIPQFDDTQAAIIYDEFGGKKAGEISGEEAAQNLVEMLQTDHDVVRLAAVSYIFRIERFLERIDENFKKLQSREKTMASIEFGANKIADASRAKTDWARFGPELYEGAEETNAENKARQSGQEGSTGNQEPHPTTGIKQRIAPDNSPVPSRPQFNQVLSRLAAAEVDVEIFQQRLDGLVNEFYQREGGGYGITQGIHFIKLVMEDVTAPSEENFTTLLHETVHFLFAKESPELRAAILQAISNLSDKALGIESSPDPRIRESNPQRLSYEILQEERLAESLARAGITEPKSIAAKIVEFLRELYLRITVEIQKALFGSENINPDLALQYFKAKARGFFHPRLSVVDFFGGPRLSVEGKVKLFTPAMGVSAFSSFWNAQEMRLEANEVLPTSPDAIGLNIQNYRKPHDVMAPREASPDLLPEVKAADFAANNTVDDALHVLYDTWTNLDHNTNIRGGPLLSLDEYIAWVLPPNFSPPQKTITAGLEELKRIGLSPINATTKIADLNEFTQKEAASKAHAMLQRLRAHFSQRRSEAEFETSGKPGSLQSKFDRSATKIVRLTREYTNADFIFSEARKDLDELVQEFREDAKQIKDTARKLGAISQVLRDLDEKAEAPRAYLSAINNLYRKLSGDTNTQRRFVDLLSTVAQINLDWRLMTMGEIKKVLKAAAATHPTLEPLVHPNLDSKALLAVVASFARSNQLTMDLLELRRSDLTAERNTINTALQTAMKDNKEAFKEARSLVRALPRLSHLAARLLDELEREKAKNSSMLNELHRHRTFIDFHEDTRTALREEMARLEKILGATDLAFEAVDGVKYIVPGNANWSPEMVEAKQKEFRQTRDGSLNAELKTDLRKMQAWLDQHGPGHPLYRGVTYTRLEQQIEKLLQNEMASEVHSHRRSLTIRLLGSMADKLRDTGHPACQSMARRLVRFTDFVHRFRSDTEVIGVKYANAERKAMNAVGLPLQRLDTFKKLFYDRPLAYIEQRKDILASSKDLPSAQDTVLKEVRSYLLSDPETATLVSRPGAWAALEYFYRTTAECSDAMVKMAQAMGVKIEDSASGIFRDTKGAPLFETMRRVSGSLALTYEKMRLTWLNQPIDPQQIVAEYASDPDALRQKLAPLFAVDIWQNFVKPLAFKPGRSVFYAPADPSGAFQLARVEDCRKAFASARGDVIAFAEHLYAICGGTTDKAEFVGETLSTFKNFFEDVHSLHQQQSVGSRLNIEPVQHLLMDARRSEEFPPEWLDYRRYDLHTTRSILNHLAYHAAFGRDMVGAESDFQNAMQTMQRLETQLRDEVIAPVQKVHAGKTSRTIREALRIEAEKIGGKGYLTTLENASRDLAMLRAEKANFEAFIQSQSGIALEVKPWADLMSAAVGLVVQGPGTALTDTVSMFKPIAEYGLSTQALSQIATSLKSFAVENVGSFLEVFGKTIKFNADNVRRRHALGIYESNRQTTLKERVAAIMQSSPESEGLGRMVSLGSRIARAGLNTGLKAESAAGDFYSFKPHALFTQVGQTMHAAVIDGVWKVYSDAVMRAAQYFETHTAERDNPSFQFSGNHLGYTKKFYGLLNDESAFEYLKAKLEQNGMTLESLARDYLHRRTTDPNAPLLKDGDFQKLAVIGPNEITLESSIVSRPSSLLTNPVLHFAVPLLGWSISQVASGARSFKGPQGETDLKAFKKGLLAFGALMGVSVAYSLLRDEYDEEILGKKANVLDLDENIPLSLIDRMARVGQLGIVGDFANSLVNIDTNRPFSVDSRVFAVSALMGMKDALGTWYRQGEGTYATVWRPLAQAMGGSGYLQYAQILNQALDLDNAESRVTARINANNYLRAVGRELNLDVRTSAGATALPNTIKPYITEMALAAYANDPLGFREAYRKAVASAREEGKSDPVDYVKRSFQYQHPLRSVFRTAPSETEYHQILLALSEEGRRDVSEAVRLFNHFGAVLGVAPYSGKEKKPAPSGAVAVREDYRARAVKIFSEKEKFFLQ